MVLGRGVGEGGPWSSDQNTRISPSCRDHTNMHYVVSVGAYVKIYIYKDVCVSSAVRVCLHIHTEGGMINPKSVNH